MKKLMIALASAATAVFAFGEDVLPHGADFENANYTAGENFTNYVNKADDGATESVGYWYSASDDIGVISNHLQVSVKSVPDLYENATPTGGVNFLQLDTQLPLFRTIKSQDHTGTFTGVDMSTGDGIYLDTLVKFTAADEPFGTNSLEAVDKIAIEYVEREIEYGTGDEATVVKVTPLTNFVVRAGFIASSTALVATNYVVALPDGWLENNKKDAWHRLTVRALTNIDGHDRVGFKIYLDEVPLVYRTDNDEFAQSAGFDDDTHTIFPSAVETDKNNYNEISAVAFSGNGSIDDVVFTTTKPKFIAESEAVVVPFVADPGVTAISVSVDGEDDPFDVVNGVATLPPQTAAFTVNVTVDEANGYKLGSISYGGTPVVDGEVTGYTGGDITITTIRNNFNLFDANRDPIQGTFQTLSEALAVEGVAKIQLAHNYEVTEAEITAAEESIYTIDGDVVIDLYGMTLDGGEGNGFELFYVTGSLKVIDSVGGGKIVYGGNVFGSEGSLLVGDVSGDNGVTIDGVLFNDQAPGYIIRANVLAEDNTDTEDAFLWKGSLGDGEVIESEAKLVGDYWVVTPKGGGDEDWKDPSEITKDATAGEVYGITGDLAAADAVELTVWATGEGNVDFADKDTINVDCFLLNIANDSTAQQIQDEKDEFVVTISFDSNGDPVITAPDGKTYNGKLIIKGSDDLSIPKANWDEQTDGDTFFYGELSL